MTRLRLPALALSVSFALAAPAQTATPDDLLEEAADLYGRGDVEEALALWARTSEIAGDGPTAAAARNNRCVILRMRGEVEAALDDCRAAVALREDLDEPAGLARSSNNLGLALQEAARFDEAEPAFQRALELYRSLGDVGAEVLVLNNLAALHSTRGAHADALEALDRVDTFVGEHPDEAWAREQQIVAVLNRGVALEGIGAFREALDLSLPWTEPGRLDDLRRGALLVNLGTLYRNLGDAGLAISSFESGSSLLERAGDAIGAANATLNRGRTLHLNLERPEEARELLRETVDRFVAIGARSEEIRARVAFGQVLLDLGLLDEAGDALEAAADLAEANDDREGRWTALHGLARLDRLRGNVEAAIDRLERALRVVEIGGSRLRDPRRWSDYLSERRAVHELLVDSLLARSRPGDEARALRTVWTAKARDIFGARRGESPDGAASLRGSSEALARVTSTLGDSWLVELFVSEGRLLRFLLREGALVVKDLGEAAAFPRLGEEMTEAVLGTHDPAPAARTLGDLLLGDLERDLRGRPPSALRIAPDLDGERVAFDLLRLGGDDLVSLVDVATVPSGWLLGGAVVSGRKPGTVLAVAPDWRSGAAGTRLAERLRLPDLPGAQREIDSVRRRLRSRLTVLDRAAATETAVERALAARPSVLHLATHTVLDAGTPTVLLSADDGEDGLWTPDEILDAAVGPRLVVLSSCRTAGGPRGHGLSSLSGAFLASGSDAVVATLWEVEDDTTAVFMDRFYGELARGQAPVAALSRVKRLFREDPRWAAPSGWAAFVLIGNGADPVLAGRSRAAWVGVLALALATALGFAAVRRRRRADH